LFLTLRGPGKFWLGIAALVLKDRVYITFEANGKLSQHRRLWDAVRKKLYRTHLTQKAAKSDRF